MKYTFSFEPQCNISDYEYQTEHVPCNLNEAHIVAVYKDSIGHDGLPNGEPEWVGDMNPIQFKSLLMQLRLYP